MLVVEDEVGLAQALKRGLEQEGFSVEVAHDGRTGLWLAMETNPDVIVLDVMLPKLNGFQVCAELRKAENWTPILMLTAKEGEFDHAEGLDTGADDYLSKPVSLRHPPRPPSSAPPTREPRPARSPLRGRPRDRPGGPPLLAQRGPHRADSSAVRAPRVPHAQKG